MRSCCLAKVRDEAKSARLLVDRPDINCTSLLHNPDIAMFAGHILFHGPQQDVVPFFESLGFKCPPRKGIPDFLQEVSGRKDQQVSSLWLRCSIRATRASLLAVSSTSGVFQS